MLLYPHLVWDRALPILLIFVLTCRAIESAPNDFAPPKLESVRHLEQEGSAAAAARPLASAFLDSLARSFMGVLPDLSSQVAQTFIAPLESTFLPLLKQDGHKQDIGGGGTTTNVVRDGDRPVIIIHVNNNPPPSSPP
eukprot:Gregarina_sp_Poly_1__728@NODE_1173_length_4867_cov_47_652708_g804_i0_p5_GENE_NODE_1173_length_4867_cov_47_652708_g804_i0NODE_1173_length_4867_cov_47_652708_g804_i0_p5_ORF_typecomplete_len138_score17_87_NODE_1173_length_4867_cov_47_652708_g804_i0118531